MNFSFLRDKYSISFHYNSDFLSHLIVADGTGVPPGTKPETCQQCKGSGMVNAPCLHHSAHLFNIFVYLCVHLVFIFDIWKFMLSRLLFVECRNICKQGPSGCK
jgi:hypothetical protein